MKRDILFVCVFMIFGLCVGFPIPSVILLRSLDVIIGDLLTLPEMAQLESATASMCRFLGTHLTLVRIIWVILTIIVLAFVLGWLNPHFWSVLTRRAKKAKFIVVILCCLVLFSLLIFLSAQGPIRNTFETLFDLSEVFFSIPSAELPDLPYGLFLILGTVVLWLIAGEIGWAGDFSSWRMDRGTIGLKLVMTLLMGAAVGVIAYYVRYLFSWSSQQYFILLGVGPDMFPFRWVRLFTYELMFTLAFSLGIVAGFVTVLAPWHMAVRQRLLRLLVPAALLTIYIPVVIGTYWYAHIRYDLGKHSLAEAVGIPGKGRVSKTVVKLMPEKPILQEWPMQAEGWSWNGSETFELSYENLRKIEEYLHEHKEGSVFYQAGLFGLGNGYFRLWDTKKAMDQMFRNTPYYDGCRFELLIHLPYMPVTPENEKYLRDFADETKWHVGKAGTLRLAKAFMHFGHADEAKKWAGKAKAKGEDLSKATFLTGPVFTRGTVSGAFKVDDVPLVGAKVALFAGYPGYRSTVDVRTTDASGKFTFTNLGRGEYILAVMTDKETVPYSLPPGHIKVKNASGAIKLDINNPSRNVGDINILTK